MAKPDGKQPVRKILERVINRGESQEDPAPKTETEDVPEKDESDQDISEDKEDAEVDVETEEDSDEDSEEETEAEAINAEDESDETEDEDEPGETQAQSYSPEYVKKLREEAKKRRLEAKAAQKKLADLEARQVEAKKKADRSKMDQVTRLQAELREKDEQLEILERGITQVAKENSVISKAIQMGFRNAKDAVILLGNVLDDMELTEDGDLDDVELEEALSDLAVARPYLINDEPKGQDMSKKVIVSADRKGEVSKRRAARTKDAKEEDKEKEIKERITDAHQMRDGKKAFLAHWDKFLLERKRIDNPIWKGKR